MKTDPSGVWLEALFDTGNTESMEPTDSASGEACANNTRAGILNAEKKRYLREKHLMEAELNRTRMDLETASVAINCSCVGFASYRDRT